MKKILSFALSILMIVSCFAFTVSAKEITIGEGYDYALAIDDVDAKVGDTVTVKITALFDTVGIGSGEFEIKYPSDKLELVQVDEYYDEDTEETTPGTPRWLFKKA